MVATANIAEAIKETPEKRSSFHMPMRLLPSPRQEDLFALYDLCRNWDDAVDHAASPEAAIEAIDRWEAELDLIFNGGIPSFEEARILQELYWKYDLNPDHCRAVFQSLRMDAEGKMLYPSQKRLKTYCNGVAGAVGLMALRIFGCDDKKHGPAFAIALGHGLQLTNILRDICEDAAQGRVYLPKEWADAVGVEPVSPKKLRTQPELIQALCAYAGEQANLCFKEAGELAKKLPIRQIAPALAMRDVYRIYWQKLKNNNWVAPKDSQLHLGLWDRMQLSMKAAKYRLG
ncbi:MAG: phytoene/squalene synthase family protein [Rickettsiales bacterium]